MSSMVIKVIEALGPAMKTGIDSAYSKPCPVPGGAKMAEAGSSLDWWLFRQRTREGLWEAKAEGSSEDLGQGNQSQV